jgi:hypothetical protein
MLMSKVRRYQLLQPEKKKPPFKTPYLQFGRPFAIATMANDPPRVPQRVLSKLAVYVPPIELVDAYLEEIARGYNVDWRAPVRGRKVDNDDDDNDGDEGGLKVSLAWSSRLSASGLLIFDNAGYYRSNADSQSSRATFTC